MHETRHVEGRTVLASNSVLFVASAPVGWAAQLDTFASDLVAHGCSIHTQSIETVSLFRFETFVTPLLLAAEASVQRTGLAASATMAVKVLIDGRHRPSPKSLDIGMTLARETSPGKLVLSLRLGSLLQATEPECAGMLRTTSVAMANGRRRAVVMFDGSRALRTAVEGGFGEVLGTLPASLVERLVYRIHQRVQAVAPEVNERVVRDAVTTSRNAVAIASRLAQQAAGEAHAAIRLIVDDEVRWIRLRREPAGSGDRA